MFDAKAAVAAILQGKTTARVRSPASRLATVLMLVDADPVLIRYALQGLREGRFGADVQFLEAMYWSSHARFRPQIAGTGVVASLPPPRFRRIWLDALRRSGAETRGRLAEGLLAFINHNPSQAPAYEAQIRSLVREKSIVARRTGVLLLSALDTVTTADLALIARYLRDANADMRICALGAVQRWAMRFDVLPRAVREFLCSPEVLFEIRRARRDTDEGIRMAGRNATRLLRVHSACTSQSRPRATPSRDRRGRREER